MSDSLATLLPMLQCPTCQGGEMTRIRGNFPETLPFEAAKEFLQCTACQTNYPLTDDLIPVMWSEALKVQMLAPPDPDSNIGANLQIYNAISDDYKQYTRQLPGNALRIQDGAARILAHTGDKNPYLHLDFGCGPGQVIGWLKDEDLLSVGFDVSLVNLRNTRKSTGALVVCGDATRMPFKSDQFDLVTEASVLHHILDWRAAAGEACRVCQPGGGILLDAEPSQEMVAFSKLAIFVFNLRFPVYKLVSYFKKDKYIFRDTEQAKLNLKAEIHHQPGTGFPLDELAEIFTQAGFQLHLFHSPGADLDTRKPPKFKNIILNLLSLRNPWNPKLGSFTAIGTNSTTRPERRSTP